MDLEAKLNVQYVVVELPASRLRGTVNNTKTRLLNTIINT